MEESYHLSRAGTQDSAPGLSRGGKKQQQMKSSAPPQRQGLPQENKFIDERGLSPGVSGGAAEVVLLLPSALEFRVVESPRITRRHQGTLCKETWGHACSSGDGSEAAQRPRVIQPPGRGTCFREETSQYRLGVLVACP